MSRVALVTGGTRGIGEAISLRLKEEGYKVAASYVSRDEDAQKFMKKTGVHVYKFDVAIFDQCSEKIKEIEKDLGPVEILINNAGASWGEPYAKYSEKGWDKVMDLNVKSIFYLTQKLTPILKMNASIEDPSRIINIGSMHSLFGAPLGSAYSASKGGVVQLTKSLANTWAKDNIQVNAVLPGYIDTTLTRQARVDIPELQKRVEERTPAGRWGDPDDLGGIAVFLSSDASNYVTGTAIPVDGGYSING